jgi:6,7-dimethyl-8-ribityllumazine synthase
MEASINDHIILNMNYHNRDGEEFPYEPRDGCKILIFNLIIFLAGLSIGIFPSVFAYQFWVWAIAGPLIIFSLFVVWFGFFIIRPNEAGIVTLCGSYKGTVRRVGLNWINPFMFVSKVSLKSKNFMGNTMKVNDKSGSPIEIGIVTVWKIKDTYKAKYAVEDYNNYVAIQSEAAVRNLAYSFSYDKVGDNEVCLKSGNNIITDHLIDQLSERFAKAGIEVEEAKVTHLAYAPEIASSMLKKQQAQAIIDARQMIVHGALSIVEQTIHTLNANNICELDKDQKAKIVNSLLTVLCSDNHVQPVLSTN